MPIFGPIIRTVRGVTEGWKLSDQIQGLEELSRREVTSLMPESYRQCAELRLAVARLGASHSADRGGSEQTVVDAFEAVRQGGLARMLDDSSKQPVTRDEMVRVVHSLDQLARALHEDVSSQNAGIEALSGETRQLLKSQDARIEGLRQDTQRLLESHAAKLESMRQDTRNLLESQNAKIEGIGEETQRLFASQQSIIGGLGGRLRSCRTWVYVALAVGLLDLVALLYVIAQTVHR